MKLSHLVSIALLLFVSSFAKAQPIWEPTGGPEGGGSACFATNRTSTVFYATGPGVIISSDSGRSWSPFGLERELVFSLVVDTNDVVFAGTRYGIFRRTASTQWVHADSGITNANDFLIGVNRNNVLFAEAFGNGGGSRHCFRSTNSGASWDSINNGLSIGAGDGEIGIAPNGYLYVGARNSIYYSTNNGDSWTITGLQFAPYWHFAFESTDWNDSTVYAWSASNVIKSTNNGQTWSQVGTLNSILISMTYVVPYLYVGTYQGVMRYSPIDNSWHTIGLADLNINALIGVGGGTLIAGTGVDGIFWGHDSIWTRSQGTPAIPFTILRRDTTVYAGAYNGIFKSTNRGDVWQQITPPGRHGQCFTIDSFGNFYLGGFNGLFRSTNNGVNWDSIAFDDYEIAICTAPMNNLYVASSWDIYRSTDNGEIFTPIVTTLGAGIQIFSISTFPTLIPESWQVYAATDSGLYRCLEDGRNWSRVGMAGISVLQVRSSVGRELIAATRSGAYSSTNGGDSWTQTAFTQPVYALYCYADGATMFSSDSTIYRTTDNFASWTDYGSGFPRGYPAWCLDSCYAGDYGVYRLRQPENVRNGTTYRLPETLRLLPNYPNPFNSTTVISFTLPRGADTKVEIFNITGQLVQTLAKSRMAPGIHRVTWNAETLPSGLYWCRLSAGGETSVARMLYLK